MSSPVSWWKPAPPGAWLRMRGLGSPLDLEPTWESRGSAWLAAVPPAPGSEWASLVVLLNERMNPAQEN